MLKMFICSKLVAVQEWSKNTVKLRRVSCPGVLVHHNISNKQFPSKCFFFFFLFPFFIKRKKQIHSFMHFFLLSTCVYHTFCKTKKSQIQTFACKVKSCVAADLWVYGRPNWMLVHLPVRHYRAGEDGNWGPIVLLFLHLTRQNEGLKQGQFK